MSECGSVSESGTANVQCPMSSLRMSNVLAFKYLNVFIYECLNVHVGTSECVILPMSIVINVRMS